MYIEMAVCQRCGDKKMMCYKDLKLYHTISSQRLFITPSGKRTSVAQLSSFSVATTTLFSLLRFHNYQHILI